ncbi:hypothetical protein [Streptomyces sp. NPDC056244]|uniref:hypothetical protein n=1 Tax=Streptomyces sp. NPDC056244 TaxID=3345762 RepID=UPI0035E2D636
MAEKTGVEPAIAYDDSNESIRLTHVNGRLRTEILFRRGSRGWQRGDYQVFRDGERIKRPTWEGYFALLERLPADPASLAVLSAPAPIAKQATLPVEIRQHLTLCEKRLGDRRDITLSVGLDEKGRYVLVIAGAWATIHITFEARRRNGRKSAVVASTNSVRVVTTDGRDLTDEFQNKLDKALARLMITDPPVTGTAGVSTGSTQGAQSGGASDRKGTVLRV